MKSINSKMEFLMRLEKETYFLYLILYSNYLFSGGERFVFNCFLSTERGVDHDYIKPGVVARACNLGTWEVTASSCIVDSRPA